MSNGSPPPTDTLTALDSDRRLQLEKLTLEVEQLRAKATPSSRLLAALTPMLPAMIAVIGVWAGLHQFQTERTDSERQQLAAQAQRDADVKRLREFELQAPFWERRLRLYFDAAAAAGTLASAPPGPARTAAEATFWQLYNGPLAIVEDDAVEGAMVSFGKCLSGEEQCTRDTLVRRSLALAHSCRQSIGETWRLGLGELKGKYQSLN